MLFVIGNNETSRQRPLCGQFVIIIFLFFLLVGSFQSLARWQLNWRNIVPVTMIWPHWAHSLAWFEMAWAHYIIARLGGVNIIPCSCWWHFSLSRSLSFSLSRSLLVVPENTYKYISRLDERESARVCLKFIMVIGQRLEYWGTFCHDCDGTNTINLFPLTPVMPDTHTTWQKYCLSVLAIVSPVHTHNLLQLLSVLLARPANRRESSWFQSKVIIVWGERREAQQCTLGDNHPTNIRNQLARPTAIWY